MGLFRASSKTPETQKILLKKKNGLVKKASSSWENEDSPNDATGKPKFWRLHDELAKEIKQDDHQPPTNIISSPKEPLRHKKLVRKKKAMMFQKLDSVDELSASNTTPSKKELRSKTPSKRSSQKKRSRRTNMPLHTLNEDSISRGSASEIRLHQRAWTKGSHSGESGTSSSVEYQPPPPFTLRNETSSADVVQDKKSSRQFQTFMHERIAESFSDDTMDKHQARSIQTSTSDTQSAGLYSESGFPTSKGGHQFQQIVFDKKFNEIEKVKVAKSGRCRKGLVQSYSHNSSSDPGASDFSDFITAAAKLTKNFSHATADGRKPNHSHGGIKPASKTPQQNSTQKVWPRLDDRKIRDTPGYGGARGLFSNKHIRAGSSPARSRSPVVPRMQFSNDNASRMRTTASKGMVTSPEKVASSLIHSRAQASTSSKIHLRTPLPEAAQPQSILPKQENSYQCSSPSRPKSPATTKSPRPAAGSAADGEKVKTSFQSQCRSIVLEATNRKSTTETSAIKNKDASNLSNELWDGVKRIGPCVTTSRDEWISNSSSFVQSDVSFTPEHAFSSDEFGFKRDFEGFGEPAAKRNDNVSRSEKIKKVRAESFDWDTEFHRCASPFQAKQNHDNQRCTHATVSLDEELITKPRVLSVQIAQRKPSKMPDQSPMSAQRSMKKTSGSRASMQSQGPQKTPPKAVPTNAILGSMLFRQTQISSIPDQNNGGSSKIVESRSHDATQSSFIRENRSIEASSSMFSRKQPSFIAANRSKDTSDSKNPSGKHATDKVPIAITTPAGETASVVSSVTEEASSFYKKNFGGKSPRWNGPAQTLLNNYNVRKNHVRNITKNTTHSFGNPTNNGLFSKSEEDHINIFLSEV